MRYYLYQGAYHAIERGRMPKGAVRLPRLPRAGEHWHAGTAEFVRDEVAALSLALPADHVACVHAIKAVEASIVLSGVALTHGMLAEEARAIGVAIEDLARQVAEHGALQRAVEVARRKVKLEGKQT